MWIYEKKLIYPVNIKSADLKCAKLLAKKYSGPDSLLISAASYLTQRFCATDERIRATLNDIGTEKLAHWEMIGAMLYQILENAPEDKIKKAGLKGFVKPGGVNVLTNDAAAVSICCTGDAEADLSCDIAAERRSAALYEHMLSLEPEETLKACLNFLRARDLVHMQRLGECLGIVNGLFDRRPSCSIDMREKFLSGKKPAPASPPVTTTE
ncbi:MAG: manganese catalase family protein [Christensenellales bacterium]|jgi:spore coat protein JC